MKKETVCAELANFGREIRIGICVEDFDKRTVAYAKPVEFEMRALDNDDAGLFPAFTLGPTGAQVLMDELWRIGLRPSEGTGSAGSLAATERHLKDMREIAFGVMRQSKVIE